jgi:hypothetical protein
MFSISVLSSHYCSSYSISFQCICNDFTSVVVVPTAPPTTSAAPSSSMSPSLSPTTEEQKADAGGGVIPVIDLDACQQFNPDTGKANPFQEGADKYGIETCFAGGGCPQGSCCQVGYCWCLPLDSTALNEKDCIPGYEA